MANSIPALILSFEIALISPIFIFTFPWTPYKIGYGASRGQETKHYQGGFLGLHAVLSALNIIDIFIALGKGLQAKIGAVSRNTQHALPPSNYYVLNENGTRYYPDGNQERILR